MVLVDRWRVLARFWWLGLVLVAASACQAELDVVVTVAEDGSGTVETTTFIDAGATEQLLDLDLDATGLVLGDLAQSGWVIDRPETAADGSTVITASKAFGTAAQFSEVMEELTGADGPIQDFRLIRTKRFARVDYAIEGTLDTTGAFDSFTDADLERALGRSVDEIAGEYGASEDQVGIDLAVILPGELQGEAPNGIIEADTSQVRASWSVSLADDEVVDVALSSATRQVAPLVLRGVAITAAALAGVVVFAQVLRILLPDRRRRPKGRPSPKPPARTSSAEAPSEPEPDPETAQAATSGADGPAYRVVALDAMGVLYREANDIATLLAPFVQERTTMGVTDEEIAARARALSLGRITTGQFWQAVGVEGDTHELDTAYLARHQLTPGVIKYLRRLREDGIRAACITNDAATWATMLRAAHSLEGLIDPWVVSGSVGVRKPDKPIFEVLRRMTGEPSSSILIVDDDLDILDAARDYGYATAWFTADGTTEVARDHLIIRSFDGAEDDGGAEPDVAARSDTTSRAGDSA